MSKTLAITILANVRVAGTEFVPKHSKNGKNINDRLTIRVISNIPGLENNGEGRSDAYPLTLWGKLTHTAAKSLSRGKLISCICEPGTYDGRVFQPSAVEGQPGQVVMRNDGTGPLTVKKPTYKIIPAFLSFGRESRKFIMSEIQAGFRGIHWDIPGHPDHQRWLDTLKARREAEFDPKSPTYGYATVRHASGPGIGAYNENAAAPQEENTNINAMIAAAMGMGGSSGGNGVVLPNTVPSNPAGGQNVVFHQPGV
jgi:hypothetical protein